MGDPRRLTKTIKSHTGSLDGDVFIKIYGEYFHLISSLSTLRKTFPSSIQEPFSMIKNNFRAPLDIIDEYYSRIGDTIWCKERREIVLKPVFKNVMEFVFPLLCSPSRDN